MNMNIDRLDELCEKVFHISGYVLLWIAAVLVLLTSATQIARWLQ